MPNLLLKNSSLVWIPAGLLGEVESKVVAHLCCDAKALWDENVDDGANCYTGMPDDLNAFVYSLKRDD